VLGLIHLAMESVARNRTAPKARPSLRSKIPVTYVQPFPCPCSLVMGDTTTGSVVVVSRHVDSRCRPRPSARLSFVRGRRVASPFNPRTSTGFSNFRCHTRAVAPNLVLHVTSYAPVAVAVAGHRDPSAPSGPIPISAGISGCSRFGTACGALENCAFSAGRKRF